MNDGRAYLLRVWQLAEELAVSSGTPLQAFLLLHRVLTRPPPALRRGATSGTSVASATTASNAAAGAASPPSPALPLHLPSLDAEWKCEELATRVRAAEYLLFPDAAAGSWMVRGETPSRSTSHTLSRAAALESLELAEQVLTPVFAASSTSSASLGVGWSGWHRGSTRHTEKDNNNNNNDDAPHRSAVCNDGDDTRSPRSTMSLDSVWSEVAQTSTKASCATSGSARNVRDQPPHASNVISSSAAAPFGTGSSGGEVRVGSMYFLNESTVTALAWPLSPFTLSWPSHGTPTTQSNHLPKTSVSATTTTAGLTSAASPSAGAPTSLNFNAANQTIMIAVALVVRAHVLQAVVCHRRVQYKRALQCLAEARQWVRRQFDEAAQRRSLRLLRADLQERWNQRESGQVCQGTCEGTAEALNACVNNLTAHLPHFDRVMRRLMELERRACEAVISVEECKVHFMILQSCGALPPPPLTVRIPSPEQEEEQGYEANGGTAAAPRATAAHAPDLRLHYKRYQESVQQLHRISSVYMRLLAWMDEDEGGETDVDGENDGIGRPMRSGDGADAPTARRVRVKVESSGETEESNEDEAVLSRHDVLQVRSQLSCFCLCAVQKHRSASSSIKQPNNTSEVKQEPVAADRRLWHEQPSVSATAGAATSSPPSTFVLNFDMRLAAEVLGWYHCLSFFYVLYQHTSNSAVTTGNGDGDGGAARDRRAQGEVMTEATFIARYAGLSAYSPNTNSHLTAAPPSAGGLRDPVQRALAHFRIYAYVFGSPPATQDTLNNNNNNNNNPQWRASPAAPISFTSLSSPTTPISATTSPHVHEAALLWCLAEVALADNYPFALRFGSATKGLAASQSAAKQESTGFTESAAVSATVKREVVEDDGEAHYAVADSAGRSRTVSSGGTDGGGKRARAMVYTPPPSWHWVLPGVRTVLLLYLELTTVLMQAAATMQPAPTTATTPAAVAGPGVTRGGLAASLVTASTSSPASSAAAVAAGAAAGTAASAHASLPPVPVLQYGLHRAEEVLARLLFALDREMLQLTGNAWSIAAAAMHPPPSSAATRVAGGTFRSAVPPLHAVDHLQSSPPAQLRWLVQTKTAALLTTARHHLTQLSLVRAVYHLREVQHFTRVFHHQTKLSLLPETHVLLATLATCMGLRRLPDLYLLHQRQHRRQKRHREVEARRHGAARLLEDDTEDDSPERDGDESNGDRSSNDGSMGSAAGDRRESTTHRPQHRDAAALQDALFHFAQGWRAVDETPLRPTGNMSLGGGGRGDNVTAGGSSSNISDGTSGLSAPAVAFAITPAEEATVAQDVGLPYLHLLAAERAACTSLHTSPAFILLLYLLKAWAVYQLVVGGEELTWRVQIDTPDHGQRPSGRQFVAEQSEQQSNAPAVSPLSPLSGPVPLPLPTASYATTTLNSTVEDQQRRVARLDSVTSTPTSTPQLRSRHATLPAEMQRIQLDPPALTSPVLSPVQRAEAASLENGKSLQSTSMPPGERTCCRDGASNSVKAGPPLPSSVTPPPPKLATPTASAAAPTSLSPPPNCPPLSAANSLPPTVTLPPPLAQQQQQQQQRPPAARVTAVPHTVRHRAGDVLQRMLAVLRHHHDAYALYTTEVAQTNREAFGAMTSLHAVPTTAWTPQNVVLFRLLRGAVLLTEDRDEPAAARELKETTHLAKQRLGVLHPYVADGLALLTSAYTSLDVDTAPSLSAGVSSTGSTSSSSSSSHNTSGGSGGVGGAPAQDGASRTRRVAVQLAMRCSCSALASLAASSDATGVSNNNSNYTDTSATFAAHSLSSAANRAAGSSVSGGSDGGFANGVASHAGALNSLSNGGGGGLGGAAPPQLHQQQQFAAMQARLRDWWTSQVLDDLCGNESPHRSAQAVKQLQALFEWLPGVAES